MHIRQIYVIEQETLQEAGRAAKKGSRKVAAAAVLKNPYAGQVLDDHTPLIELSYEVGNILTEKALARLGGTPRAYGKACLIGASGDLEQGASMIHCKLGRAMREGAKGGPALIPGNAKVAAMGSSIDLIFGGIEDGWDYDAMDTMQVSVPDAPRADEFVVAVAFLAGGRPNARIVGATQAQVADLVKIIRKP